MEAGINLLTSEYDHGQIKYFEKRILQEGLCKSFLPMSFVTYDGKDRVNIDYSGYRALASHEFRNSRETVYMLEKCVYALIAACDSLINPKKMELNPKTVFHSVGKKEVRFAYTPRPVPAEKTTDLLRELFESMDNSIVKGEATAYLRACASFIERSGSLIDIANYIGDLKKEIHSCSY